MKNYICILSLSFLIIFKTYFHNFISQFLFVYLQTNVHKRKTVIFQFHLKGLSWLYGCWIYNYLCYKCLSPLVVSSNSFHCKVYSIQHYVIKFVSDLR